MAVFNGTSGDNKITGTSGNDQIYGNGGVDKLSGGGGNDYIEALNARGLTGLNGQGGNDTLVGRVESWGQIHMRGGEGNDRLIMDMTNDRGHQGHHAYGGTGADRFEFRYTDRADTNTLGRIDDFDASRDSIYVDGTKLNFSSLPSNVDVVGYLGQQWLRINDNILYAIEGARFGGEEQHFRAAPAGGIASLQSETWIDQKNFVPYSLYSNQFSDSDIVFVNANTFTSATNGADLIVDQRHTSRDDNGNVDVDAGATINAGAGNDVVNAGKGNDTVRGGDGHDKIAGGLDQDRLYGDAGNDTLYGGSEVDRLYGGTGNDKAYGGTGNDYLYGQDGNDLLQGDNGNDYLRGDDGADRLYGGNDQDRLYGSDGNDRLYGQNGNDRLYGGNDEDTLYGQDGNDKLYGEVGQDILRGGNGNDLIRGGRDKDVVRGEAGADRFEFLTGDLLDWDALSGTSIERHRQVDVVEDFTVGVDVLDFSAFAGVDDRSDLRAYKTNLDGDMHFTIQVRATNERLLVDVGDNVSWGQFFNDSNFDFG